VVEEKGKDEEEVIGEKGKRGGVAIK